MSWRPKHNLTREPPEILAPWSYKSTIIEGNNLELIITLTSLLYYLSQLKVKKSSCVQRSQALSESIYDFAPPN